MALVIHPTAKIVAPIFEIEVVNETDKTIFLGNREACRPSTYDTIISFVDPDDESFQPIQDNHKIFRLFDHSDAPVQDVFPDFLVAIRAAKGRTLIHCGEGVSRSPTFLMAFLMVDHKMTHTAADDLLKSLKPNVKPNRGFLKFLRKLEVNGNV
eukprot:PhF_6_TR29313/c3_g2_i1/m.42998/K14165/K14165; atypical dual specificity phosphatase